MNKTKLPTPSSPPRSRRAPVPLVLVLLVAVQCAGWAEDVRFGAMAGVNFSRFVGSDADDANLDEESLVGFTGGGYLAVALNEIIAFQPEVVFSMKGATYEGSAGVGGFSVNWDYEIRLTYLELPVLIRVSLPLDMPLGLDAYGGMSPAILLGAEYEGEVGGVVEVDDEGDTRDDFDEFDLGIPVGGTVSFDLDIMTVFFDVRYTFGLLEMYDEDSFQDDDEPEMRNTTFSLCAGAGM